MSDRENSIVPLADCTQKVSLVELQSSTRYSGDFSFCVIYKSLLHSLNNLGDHPEIANTLTPDFLLYQLISQAVYISQL